ncbi:hypothetical protein V1508DRAFT_417476, partial [Lipomyces doorenjongii]|uniref:uncharacterized protein n=1 Tax=Lipomyces doorenjongii TaxID=383834 RepID=UPI0034CEE223
MDGPLWWRAAWVAVIAFRALAGSWCWCWCLRLYFLFFFLFLHLHSLYYTSLHLVYI